MENSNRPARRLRLLHRLAQIRALFRQRRSLASLDDHLLRDIGLEAQEAHRECAKPFWQP